MFVYRLTEPVDEFDGLTPLPVWLGGASPQGRPVGASGGAGFGRRGTPGRLAWRHAASAVGWWSAHHIGHDSVPGRQADDNGATSVVTAAEAPLWMTADVTASTRVACREIGGWTHPVAEDVAPVIRLATSVWTLAGRAY
jgi:hypothetical protein